MNKLKSAREKLGVSMQYVADALGVTRQRYYQIECNPERARIDQAKMIGKTLQTDPTRLFFDK